MNQTALIAAIGPVVLLIALGAGLKRWPRISPQFWRSAEALVYFILFPALWIDSLSRAPQLTFGDARAAAAGCAAALAGAIVLWSIRPLMKIDHAAYTSAFQGSLRFNTYIGLSLSATLFDAGGFKTAVIVAAALSVTLNILCVITLSAGRSVWRIPQALASNPLVISCVIGIALNLLGLALAAPLGDAIAALARASLPLGLLVVGGALTFRSGARRPFLVATTSVFKLTVTPAIAAGAAVIAGLAPRDAAIVIIFAALPAAPAAYSLARELGGDAALMARIISIETIASAATLTLLIALLDATLAPFAG
ncbi:MAG: AEC family transporter [Parvularculaceae bacterium]